jgi:hypothetical protein
MRGVLAGLLIAALVVIVALLVAAVGSVGVALIGLLLHRWFELSQWQGSLIALIVGAGLSVVVYRIVAAASAPPIPVNNDWDDDDDEDEEDEDEFEPPIVPWRRSRPTPGELPPQKPASPPAKPAGRKK